ncbi:MAG TPA: hypothetical protein VNW29_01850 [Candidatus Sulfotelmatobacter sp.]|jgi:hypothetical protein|nr:hypothetical protein [Candidatus Sulfotelmatobacter sp.]
MYFDIKSFSIQITISKNTIATIKSFLNKHAVIMLFFVLTMISITSYLYYLSNGLGIAYNDARSHLDIARRVVENLKPGFAQLGSVWLPLPHLLAAITVWNNFMWHSGLSGALQSMISYIATGTLIYRILKILGTSILGCIVGVLVFALNMNIMYMQSTAMTELLLLGTMTAGVYELIQWHREDKMMRLVKSSFWIMLSTMIRYDGWFLLIFATILVVIQSLKKHGYKTAEGSFFLFCTMGGFGIILWILWNLIIFKDPLYFIFGPYAAATQQSQIAAAGGLATKHNLLFSMQTYIYSIIYNAGMLQIILSFAGMLLFWFDKRINSSLRMAAIALLAPLAFNILALYLGQSVLFIQGLSGNSWFNVRYGLMMVPSIAVFTGYLVSRLKPIQTVLIALLIFVNIFAIANRDAVTIDDAVFGASGKNVTQVSGWLRQHATNTPGFVLISVASHDAIIFSSGLEMSRFIHEGTGQYWIFATAHPVHWARWIIVRTNDLNDETFRKLLSNSEFHNDYLLKEHYPFADIYEIKPQYIKDLHTQAYIEP